jgi:hypothetical protein
MIFSQKHSDLFQIYNFKRKFQIVLIIFNHHNEKNFQE